MNPLSSRITLKVEEQGIAAHDSLLIGAEYTQAMLFGRLGPVTLGFACRGEAIRVAHEVAHLAVN
jgi:hypothetical protein